MRFICLYAFICKMIFP